MDKQFQDIEGVTEKKLNIGLWYVEHRSKLRLALVIFLILTAGASWAYTVYGFGYYIYRGMKEDELLVQRMVSQGAVGHEYVARIAPRDLEYSPPKILKAAERKYDFLAEVQNANEDYWAEFDYYFLSGGKEIGRSRGFILPAQSKYLMVLGQDFGFKPTDARFIIENISWRRLDRHVIADWNAFKNERLNIAVSDIRFTSARASEVSEKINLNDLKFTAANNTAYNYWDVSFSILLWSGSSMAGVNKFTLAEFMAGQNRTVEISWPGALPQISKAEVIPEVNIMDPDIYIKYEGGVGEEK